MTEQWYIAGRTLKILQLWAWLCPATVAPAVSAGLPAVVCVGQDGSVSVAGWLPR